MTDFCLARGLVDAAAELVNGGIFDIGADGAVHLVAVGGLGGAGPEALPEAAAAHAELVFFGRKGADAVQMVELDVRNGLKVLLIHGGGDIANHAGGQRLEAGDDALGLRIQLDFYLRAHVSW